MAGGIYAKGLILGFQTIVNNLLNSYNDRSKFSFKMLNGNTLYDENIQAVFTTRKDVLEKHIFNCLYLIKISNDNIISTTQASMNLYYILFYVIFIFLLLTYCFIYLFTKESYNLLSKIEMVINNLLN